MDTLTADTLAHPSKSQRRPYSPRCCGPWDMSAVRPSLPTRWVVYLQLTDNSRVGECGTIVSFHHRERGRPHGAEPVVVPAPLGRSRVDLPPHPCRVARNPSATLQTSLQPGKPRRKRSKAPEPFTGLIHKPLCEACEQGADARPQGAWRATSCLTFTRGRQRTVNTDHISVRITIVPIMAGSAVETSAPMAIPAASPGASCSVSPATAISLRRTARSFMASAPRWSSSCASSRVSPRAWASEARRGSSRSIPIPCSSWLVEAAEQLQAFSAYFLHELRLNQVQLDELYAVLSAVRDDDVSEAEAIERLSRSPHWVWTAIDPESKLLLSIQVGERTLAMAQAVLHQIAQLLAPGLCAALSQ